MEVEGEGESDGFGGKVDVDGDVKGVVFLRRQGRVKARKEGGRRKDSISTA